MENRKFLNKCKKSINFCLLLVLSAIICSSCKKTVKIAFCDLPQEISSSVEEVVSKNSNVKYKISNISKEEFVSKNVKKIAKKNDILFANDGKIAELIEEYAKDIPENIYLNVPDRIAGDKSKKLPILLDHYGIGYCDSVRRSLNLMYPADYDGLVEYLNEVKNVTDYPIFVAGGENKELLALLTALCESIGGKEGYDSFIAVCENYLEDAENTNFNRLLTQKIYENYYFDDILKIVIDWENEGFLAKNWLNLKNIDFKAYSRDYDIGCAFLSLSQFHSLDYKIAQNYSCDRFPVQNFYVEHGIISPQIVCFGMNDKKIVNEILNDLVSAESQKELSAKTMLAPAGKNGTAYDRAADDVRFLASSCYYGSLPDCDNELLCYNEEVINRFIEEIRRAIQ